MSNYRPGLVDVDPPEDTSLAFESLARSIGINVAVDVPVEVSEWFGEGGHIPIEGLLDGSGIRGTLVPAGDGRHLLYLNKEMRHGIGIEVGDLVELVLWRDESSREVELPEDVRTALDGAGVLDRFLSWAPSHQREYLVAIEDAKRPETRRRRIESTIEQLNPLEGG